MSFIFNISKAIMDFKYFHTLNNSSDYIFNYIYENSFMLCMWIHIIMMVYTIYRHHKITSSIKRKKEILREQLNIISNLRENLLNEANEFVTLKENIEDIKSILNHKAYNDPDHFAYVGEEWTMLKLKKKSKEFGIPTLLWKNKSCLSLHLRAVEQLERIKDVFKPFNFLLDQNNPNC